MAILPKHLIHSNCTSNFTLSCTILMSDQRESSGHSMRETSVLKLQLLLQQSQFVTTTTILLCFLIEENSNGCICTILSLFCSS